MANEEVRDLIGNALSSRDQTELFYGTGRQMSVRAFNREIAALSVAESAGISARVIRESRTGGAFSERVSKDEVESIIAMADRNSAYPEADDGNILYNEPVVASYDARKCDFSEVPVEKKQELALSLEADSFARDKRIVNVPHAMYGESMGSSILGNTNGVLQDYASGYCYAYAYVMAKDGDATEVGGHAVASATFEGLDTEEIVRLAVERAVARLNATEPKSGTYRIVFDESSASDLFGSFLSGGASPFFGENIQKGRSKLAGKLGSTIGSVLFTIVDDPMAGISPRPFDSEGVATEKTAIVDKGVFQVEVHNLYSATRGGTKSTGHGSRGGFRGGIATSLHNPYIPNGEQSLDELIRETGSGIFVTDIEGLHAGLNPISGDFSLSAKGFLIENGEKTIALKNMIVAGNFYELAMKLSGIADDRRLVTHQSFSSPSIRVDDLSVSSN